MDKDINIRNTYKELKQSKNIRSIRRLKDIRNTYKELKLDRNNGKGIKDTTY